MRSVFKDSVFEGSVFEGFVPISTVPMSSVRIGSMPRAVWLLCAMLLVGIALAPEIRASRQRPVRVGIVHPSPRFCVGGEHGQKDLWVLRLAFRLGPPRIGVAGLPWFYGMVGRQEPAGAELLLTLNSQALWAAPLYALVTRNPQFPVNTPQDMNSDRLKDWRGRVMARISGRGFSTIC